MLQKIKAADGTYYRCYKQISGQQYQVRQVDKQSLNEIQRRSLVQEIYFLRLVNNAYVCKLLEVYEEDKILLLLFENFLGRDLRNRLFDYAILQEKQLAETFYKLLLGLTHLHSKGIVHRDLKPESIILKNDNNLTEVCFHNLSSAGLVSHKENDLYTNHGKALSNIGFQAPETISSKLYNFKSDVFSLGVLFYWFAYSKSPFDSCNTKEIIKLTEKCHILFHYPKSSQKNNLSASAIDLLKHMLAKDNSNRITAFQALNHHWFINMRTKDTVRQRNMAVLNEPSLSIILEKSENQELSQMDSLTQKRFQTLWKQKEKQKATSNFVITQDDGFKESLFFKLNQLNSLNLILVPSKRRHDHQIFRSLLKLQSHDSEIEDENVKQFLTTK